MTNRILLTSSKIILRTSRWEQEFLLPLANVFTHLTLDSEVAIIIRVELLTYVATLVVRSLVIMSTGTSVVSICTGADATLTAL